ncbi:hypothetical protein LCGC14_1737940 [marine sediment metagenome]|uniref:Uncharacterized protein n=1 Tax=marine sediment metagenome TaxID=412755 RepID=A0A0F9H7L5_9ZZZZ
MANLWYGIPKLTTVDRGEGKEQAVVISQSDSHDVKLTQTTTLGIDGGLTLREAEDLLWRMKQAVHLLKHGKLPPNHA